MPFKKGEINNPNGRPPVPEKEILRKAIEAAKLKHGKHLIEHAIELAYKDPNILKEILKKIVPDKLESEIVGNQVIVTFTERKADDKKV